MTILAEDESIDDGEIKVADEVRGAEEVVEGESANVDS